jgi:hypothetical protein
MSIKVKVTKEHLVLKHLFPLGFETTIEPLYTKEDKKSEGFCTSFITAEKVNGVIKRVKKPVYVEPKFTPKGTYNGSTIIGNDEVEYNTDIFYRATGRSYTEFVQKI